jgi:hypothetical protein
MDEFKKAKIVERALGGRPPCNMQVFKDFGKNGRVYVPCGKPSLWMFRRHGIGKKETAYRCAEHSRPGQQPVYWDQVFHIIEHVPTGKEYTIWSREPADLITLMHEAAKKEKQ